MLGVSREKRNSVSWAGRPVLTVQTSVSPDPNWEARFAVSVIEPHSCPFEHVVFPLKAASIFSAASVVVKVAST